ncbi:signal peptidase II [Brevibacterium sp. 5221]|uniref:Lipoprotein signal peptidase n=1 Tax=Brevibacterium rongguiense TaxID=2695267 RepID=A0A6N9H9Z8_9MICO|nr:MULTISPECIES: signal peptidase II [Brevibacterium]MYM20332.1 signal peptidase II [Brevibacterium rongguiense]WAL41076.1 signal peptidase II [Brevibacterium sp. BRM-1]
MSPARTTRSRAVLVLAAIAVVVVVADQASKACAIALLEGRPRIAVLGDLAGFAFLRNPGAAFGLGAGSTWVFGLIALAVLAVILVASRRLASPAWAVGLGLLLGGLLGNLADRVFRRPGFFRGAVVDFIDLHFFVCNVADIAITAAACTIVLATVRGVGLDGRTEAERAAAGRGAERQEAAL